MKKSNYKDTFGDGVIEEVARVKCGGDQGAHHNCCYVRYMASSLALVCERLIVVGVVCVLGLIVVGCLCVFYVLMLSGDVYMCCDKMLCGVKCVMC